jgi:hypothetical protein
MVATIFSATCREMQDQTRLRLWGPFCVEPGREDAVDRVSRPGRADS